MGALSQLVAGAREHGRRRGSRRSSSSVVADGRDDPCRAGLDCGGHAGHSSPGRHRLRLGAGGRSVARSRRRPGGRCCRDDDPQHRDDRDGCGAGTRSCRGRARVALLPHRAARAAARAARPHRALAAAPHAPCGDGPRGARRAAGGTRPDAGRAGGAGDRRGGWRGAAHIDRNEWATARRHVAGDGVAAASLSGDAPGGSSSCRTSWPSSASRSWGA